MDMRVVTCDERRWSCRYGDKALRNAME